MKNILLATDGSDGAMRATDFAAKFALALSAKLVILTIDQTMGDGALAEFARAEGTPKADIRESLAKIILSRARGRAAELGIRDIAMRNESGDAAVVILDVIGETKPEAVVLGKRGLGRIQGLLLGSVSQKLVSLSPCPVVVVP